MAMMVALSLIPPIDFFISNPSSDKWFIMILVAGFLGFYTLFINCPLFVRIVAISVFIDCFFSTAPYISFTSYVSTVGCCYFYILCRRIEDWNIIFKAFQALLFLNVLLIFMQGIGHDALLNFGLGHDFTCFGVVGQHMQMGSFSIVLCAFLVMFNPLNFIFPFLIAIFCNSSWTILSAGTGLFIWLRFYNKKYAWIFLLTCFLVFGFFAYKTGKITANTGAPSGRFEIWKQSLHFANQRPWFGWGIGTYKHTFPALEINKTQHIPYKTAHNWLIQLLFETGYPFTIFIILCAVGLLYRLWRGWHMVMVKEDRVLLLAGFSMILCDMMVHFPERMIQCVLIIICFVAYADSKRSNIV